MLVAQVLMITKLSDSNSFNSKIAQLGNPDMVKMLLDEGAGEYVNHRDSAGDTPIMYAAYGKGQGTEIGFNGKKRF